MFKKGDPEKVQVWVRTHLSVFVKYASHLLGKVQRVFVRQLEMGGV